MRRLSGVAQWGAKRVLSLVTQAKRRRNKGSFEPPDLRVQT